jgi:hypothetical protein
MLVEDAVVTPDETVTGDDLSPSTTTVFFEVRSLRCHDMQLWVLLLMSQYGIFK